MVPSAPMLRWICPLLLSAACAQALAQPLADAAPALAVAETADAAKPPADSAMLRTFERAGHVVADQAHHVADNTSALVATAVGFMGLRYRRGGNSEETGFDCSGFVRAVYEKTAGLVLPRRAKDQAASTKVIDKDELQPGDLVFFNTMRRAFSHVGVYMGDGKFIHSPRSGEKVRVDDLQASYWKKRFNGARRVSLDAQASARLAALRE